MLCIACDCQARISIDRVRCSRTCHQIYAGQQELDGGFGSLGSSENEGDKLMIYAPCFVLLFRIGDR